MNVTRRSLLKTGALLAAQLALAPSYGAALAEGLERIARRKERVLWLQGLSCTGCSISLLNAEGPIPLEIVTEIISLVYHPNLSALQGDKTGELIDQLTASKDYYFVLEGAVPVGMPEACRVADKPLTELLPPVLRNAKGIIAAGTCASYGGVPAAAGAPTGSVGLKTFMEQQSIPVKGRFLACPGCPAHPLSLVGTLAYLIGKGYPEVDPELLTPAMFFKESVHDTCPMFHFWEKRQFAEKFGEEGCLFKLGCLGPLSRTNCPKRQWNGGANWCIRAGAPCVACTSPDFARRREFPFYRLGEQLHDVNYTELERKGTSL
jgi:hydrogenase small subunit